MCMERVAQRRHMSTDTRELPFESGVDAVRTALRSHVHTDHVRGGGGAVPLATRTCSCRRIVCRSACRMRGWRHASLCWACCRT